MFDVSEQEQEISSKSAKSDHQKRLTEIIENPDIDGLAKIKVAIIYALRYEGDDMSSIYKNLSRSGQVRPEHLEFIDDILAYAGKEKWNPLLFSKATNLLAKSFDFIKASFKDVKNVFT